MWWLLRLLYVMLSRPFSRYQKGYVSTQNRQHPHKKIVAEYCWKRTAQENNNELSNQSYLLYRLAMIYFNLPRCKYLNILGLMHPHLIRSTWRLWVISMGSFRSPVVAWQGCCTTNVKKKPSEDLACFLCGLWKYLLRAYTVWKRWPQTPPEMVLMNLHIDERPRSWRWQTRSWPNISVLNLSVRTSGNVKHGAA